MGVTFSGCKALLEAASEANRDIDRCMKQLAFMASGQTVADPLAQCLEPGSSHCEPASPCMGYAADAEGMLLRRIEEDRAIVNAALRMIDGTGEGDGLRNLVGWRADALAQHYLNGLTWAQVGDLLGYCGQYVYQQSRVAFKVADSHGLAFYVTGPTEGA